MKLLFLGTRGQIDKKPRRHQRHSVLLVREDGTTILIDCGADWLGRVGSLRLDAILMTHAHPDHAQRLSKGRAMPGLRDCRELALRTTPIRSPIAGL